MSETFEVPDPVELGEDAKTPFSKKVALASAIYVILLSITSIASSYTVKNILLKQQQASDQWSYYQARSIKEEIYRMQFHHGLISSHQLQLNFAGKDKIYATAKQLEQQRDDLEERDPYYYCAEALFQVSIVLASVAILSSSLMLYNFSLVCAGLGTVLLANGLILLVRLF